MKMIKRVSAVVVIGVVLGLVHRQVHGQRIVIESLSSNGELVCGGLKPGSTATVEWAPTVNGPWTSGWAALEAVTVGADGTIRVQVPMFYRVRGELTRPAGMVWIPPGTFQMGDTFNGGPNDEQPVHTVYVSGFYMDRTEVTKELWDEVYRWAINHGYSFDNAGSGKAPDHPVVEVNWYDCVKWCNARSEKEGRVPAYYTSADQTTVYRTGRVDVQNDWVKWNAGYRLPTEAEWEKAARGGLSGRRFPWGDTISHSQANYYSFPIPSPSYAYDVSPTKRYHPTFAVGDLPYTSPVGSFAANGYGLYDMAGNVWEWCWDWYDSSYYASSPSSDPRGPSGGLVPGVPRGQLGVRRPWLPGLAPLQLLAGLQVLRFRVAVRPAPRSLRSRLAERATRGAEPAEVQRSGSPASDRAAER